MMSVWDKQVGGSHYKDCKIQPTEYIVANKMGFCEGNVIKYVTRYASKGGVEDLEKAKHYIELLIESAEEPEEKDSDSWKFNLGKKCPVDPEAKVQVMLRSGGVFSNKACQFRWAITREGDDIIKWRLAE
jgi:hypothetical protein